MRIPGRGLGRALAGLVLVGLILLSTVGSHGCMVKGASPANPGEPPAAAPAG